MFQISSFITCTQPTHLPTHILKKSRSAREKKRWTKQIYLNLFNF